MSINEEIKKALADRLNNLELCTAKYSQEECISGNHWFEPYDDYNVICIKCGRFAKVGRIQRVEEAVNNGKAKT